MAPEGKTQEPVAVVGMACRFPGATGLPAFWRQLEAGESAVVEGVPGSGAGRVGYLFPDPAVQAEACRFGAYIDEIDQFDAGFFRISPVEAQLLDPQQRLMLETSWRALEDAGIDPDTLKGSRTGVYAGISNNEYRGLILGVSDTADPAASLYTVTGTSFNTAIGRVAFALGLQGPAIAVDTACSSSLVAVHQAVTGLQRGEADLALAGGVHAILSGRLLELRANAGMLAPDGRCKTFDAAANGYVRGEGCGILVLKRLSEAEADGDRIWGVIRGSALNQDGASPGLTVPSEPAQEQVIEAALLRAGLEPWEVDYVEAHGTGTPVGDPIEMQATGTVYSRGRDADRPLLVGSVKTNIGHLESAAGAASLIKVMLAMKHRVIPKHLNFSTPNPEIEWERLTVRVASETMEWPVAPDRPPRAGISGFGWSGTNAHVIVEGYGEPIAADSESGLPAGPSVAVEVSLPPSPAAARRPLLRESSERGSRLRENDEAAPSRKGPDGARGTRLLPLSGKSRQALRQQAERYVSWLDEHPGQFPPDSAASDEALSDVAWTASVGRSHFPHRAGVVFRDAASLRERLREVAEGDETPDGPEPRAASKVAFVYTGQGSQWAGMGAALYESEPVFRAVLDRCERWVQEHRGASLLDVLFGRPGAAGNLDDPAWTQPATYALQCGLTALWSSLGVRPDVVMGHSLGEIAASQTAGVFSLEDGLRFASARGELMASLPVAGAMAAVFAPAPQVVAALAEWNAASDGLGLSVAADNGAHQVVSGEAGEVEQIVQRFEAEGLRVNRLRSSPGYHSVLVEPALDDLAAVVGGLAVAPPSVPLVSNVTGQLIEQGSVQDPAYWRRHARQPVAFRGCVETLAEMGVDAVVELGPHAVLGPMANLAWPESRPAPAVLSSLHRPPRDPNEPVLDSTGGFVEGVAAAYEAGVPLTFAGLFAGESRRRVALPGYPFQRQSYWVDEVRRRRVAAGHPLLGTRHESPRGETLFETELLPTDPAWLDDHRVFGRVIAPGALYGAMAASALAGADGAAAVEDVQLLTPLVLPEQDGEQGTAQEGRSVQMVLDAPEGTSPRGFEIFSRGDGEEGWTLHAQGRVSSGGDRQSRERIDVDALKAGMQAEDVPAFYRARAETSIDLGPLFRTLQGLWRGDGEAVGEIAPPEAVDGAGLPVHPVLLDGCFQVMAAARSREGLEDGATYLPFGWESLRLAERLPERVICHARMRGSARAADEESAATGPREVFAGDLRFYTTDGVELGGLSGYTVKRATRAAVLSGTEGVNDLLYEVVWRDKPLPEGMPSADFLPAPSIIAAGSRPFSEYLVAEGVGADERTALLADLERLSWRYALAGLEQLGWEHKAGETVEPEPLRERFGVSEEHTRLFRRLFELLARAGIVEAQGDGFVVLVGPGDPLPDAVPDDPEAFADEMAARYAHGSVEVGLFRRSANALADVLTGRADPLTLLFSSGEPTAADLYMRAPVAKAANRMLGDAVAALLKAFLEGRRLRVLEVGAGTGSATELVLPELPAGRFDYVYTDISAGFFAEAEGRFGGSEAGIDYRVLDIEKDPIAQGYDSHGYDLVIASNVLHATRYLEETLAHCRDLLAPSGQLLALENLRGQGWLDLTFGQLDGWWRFADSYRPHHALASPAVWRQALGDAGFVEAEVLGVEASATAEPDRGVIVAQGPAEVMEPAGVWVLAGDNGGVAEELAAALSARNQRVVLADAEVEPENRESWRALFEGLPADVPLSGVGHLMALDGHGPDASADEFSQDVRHAAASALALAQGMTDADVTPAKGFWLLTRGGQVLEKEHDGEVAGATLWGFGKVVAREASHLQPRMIDLDPRGQTPVSDLVNELLYPDAETHIAYRLGYRQTARLVRAGSATERLTLAEDSAWLLEPDAGGALEGLTIGPFPARPLGPLDVRVEVEAAGLNFWDLFRALGLIDEGLLGGEFCGRVLEVGSDVTSVSVGQRIVGLAFGTFGSEAVTREEMVSPVPPGFSVTELATIPTAFVSAALSFDLSGLNPGDRVLIHSGAGGVGLAAIQLAQAAGAEVLATASARKQAYLRSLGVQHVFDSRSTKFGQEILDATGGEGVHVVVNSLTGEGFIDASLSCLAQGGRFIELARLDILTEEEMAVARPDVSYAILMLDVLKEHDPATPGNALRRVMRQLAAGEVTPLVHTRWSMTEAGPAMKFMRAARHVGKIVLANSPVESGRLREDRTYLVTGGLGGIGCALAEWLAERGAGAIVLNGRRPPDPEVAEAIDALRGRGVTVQVEIADVTDAAPVDRMLERVDAALPPLAGVIHSVGVLSDAALTNQSWERFEEVLWPKVLGAWHLHRATVGRDLDMFVLFSSVAGVLGNPGQANHAAANAFLDQLAGHRRALGLPGQTIAWGAWSGLGEAEEQRERIARQLEAAGTGWITPEQGLKAFDEILRQDMTAGMVAAVDWQVFSEGHEQRPSLLEDLLTTTDEGAVDAAASRGDVLSGLWDASMEEREQMLASFLQRELQAVMRLPTPPAASVEFSELGMDSLMAVELRNRLNRAFAGEYVAPNTVVFDYPSVTALARHLAGELGEPAEAALPERRAPEAQPRSDVKDGIAIVGMACRFPGAEDLSVFWRQLIAGESAIADGREGSGDWYGAVGDPAAKESTFLRGAFVKDIDLFDSRFFRIAPIEARMMDPQQRMMLETSWQALEDAGIDPDRLRGSRTGVYAGVGGSEYRDLIQTSGRSNSYLGTTGSVTVGRVAFALGLEGPAMPMDMACASSLAAVHQAVAGLQRGEVDLALAGGVNAVLSTQVTRFMSDLGMLSANGECRTFDAAADGYVRGEGCGIVVLKRLSDAEADGDRIWGVIRGSAVNQNGASMGLTVPKGPAQERVIEEALARAGVQPSEVDYLEAHGVGSNLGDPIEVRAAAAVYGRGREADRPLLVGSVKTNIGHLESAAGIAALIKAVLAMEHGVIPKHLHLDNPNPNLDWEQLPVRVTTGTTDWPSVSGRPPRAGVSAFGLSGTNSHVIVEGYGEPAGANGENGWPAGPSVAVTVPAQESALDGAPTGRETRLLPLSGKTDRALRELAERYLSWLDEHPEQFPPDNAANDAALSDMAWTASVGRSHFPYRAGVVFRDAASLHDGLQAVAERDETPEEQEPPTASRVGFVYTGEGGQRGETAQRLYESEPVFRAVLDRCDAALREFREASLLDVMFSRPGAAGNLDDPAWSQPAIYALECALTALLSSVGVRPDVVVGHGPGEVSASQAAGVFSLEDGLRAAARRGELMASGVPDGLETALDGIAAATPSIPLVSSLTEEPGIDLVVELDLNHGFIEAVAGAYEAGLSLSFPGLFAGESRRRVALPGYPFQRRRHWIEPLERLIPGAGGC